MEDGKKHMSLVTTEKIYQGIKEVAEENEISKNKAINSILLGYLKSREARRKREEYENKIR